jgi:hypothetical protein
VSEFAEQLNMVTFIYQAVILCFLHIFCFVCGTWAEM